jgi:hypothetical protein
MKISGGSCIDKAHVNTGRNLAMAAQAADNQTTMNPAAGQRGFF